MFFVKVLFYLVTRQKFTDTFENMLDFMLSMKLKPGPEKITVWKICPQILATWADWPWIISLTKLHDSWSSCI